VPALSIIDIREPPGQTITAQAKAVNAQTEKVKSAAAKRNVKIDEKDTAGDAWNTGCLVLR